jgi:cysteine desulfurase/selenocysteine lyase
MSASVLERETARRPSDAEPLDMRLVRADFPALRQSVHGKPLVYLDNAATTQKPEQVMAAMYKYYSEDNANVHRGAHTLSERATRAYEGARGIVARFLGAAEDREIIFTRGATEAINLVAQTYGRRHVGAGDEVVVTEMEHHSNIVPWQILCEEKGARLAVAPVNDAGELVLEKFEALLNDRTRIVAVTHVSNALGTVNPIRTIVDMAHARGIPVLVDGAQAVPHLPVDVRALDADWYVFSGHKVYGPTGIGALYGKADVLGAMPPWQGGGDMIRSVSFDGTTYNDIPYRFEAGTPHIAGAVGLGAALEYVEGLGRARVEAHESDLLAYADEALDTVPGLRRIGTATDRAGAVSFVLADIHPHDIATVLDTKGIAIRAGHHCAQPVMKRFGVPATARASFACYNTREDVDALVAGLNSAREVFGL